MKNALEIAIYKIKNGASEADFIQAGVEMEENFIKKQKKLKAYGFR